MRNLTILIGIGLCAIGILFSPLWLIAVGLLLLAGSSFVPDRPLKLFNTELTLANQSDRSALSSAGWLALGSGLLITTTVVGTNNNPDAIWPLLSWSAGLLLACSAVVVRDQQTGAWSQLSQKWHSLKQQSWIQPELIYVVVLTAIAFYLRLIQLESLPPMHGDEGEMGLRAARVLSSDDSLPPFITGFLDHPTLFHYLQALSIGIFGQTVSGLRAISVLFGALCVPAIYAAGRIGYGRLVGLIAASFIAFSHIHIHFSRIGLNNIHSVFMAIVLFAAVLWCDRSLSDESDRKALAPWFIVGLICGLAQYFYYGSRLLPFLLLAWFAIIWWRHRASWGMHQFLQLSLIPVGFLAGWSPLIPTFVRKPVTFIARQTGVSVFSEKNIQAILGESATTTDILLYQIERNLRFFIDSGDVSSFYFSAVPGLSTLAAILFWVGLGLALAKIARFPNGLLISWLIFGVGLGGVLTNTSPAATRLIMVYPAVGLLCGLAAETILAFLIGPQAQKRTFELGLAAVVSIFLAFSGYQIYFQTYAVNPPQSHMIKISRAFAQHSAQADGFLLGGNILYVNHGTVHYLNQNADLKNLAEASDLPITDLTKPALFFVSVPAKEDQLALLMQQYPDGEYEQVEAPNGRLLFSTYLVDRP